MCHAQRWHIRRGADENRMEQSMAKPPPVPPDNQSHKGTGDPKTAKPDQAGKASRSENAREQGQQGNIAQNTTNQGYQQDR
jgi:hypothetical protein